MKTLQELRDSSSLEERAKYIRIAKDIIKHGEWLIKEGLTSNICQMSINIARLKSELKTYNPYRKLPPHGHVERLIQQAQEHGVI